MHIKTALINLFSTKLRSILAALGILVGTASVVAMVSGGELATYQALQQFKKLGTNLLSISINAMQNNNDSSEKDAKLSLQTAMNIKSASSDITLVAPYASYYSPVTFNGNEVQNASAIGITETLPSVIKLTLFKGRFVNYLDHYSPYCTIGYDVYQKIKIYSPNPIGQQIKLGNNFCTIVGIANDWEQNSFLYADLNNSILVPIEYALLMNKYTDIYNVVMQINPNANLDQLDQDIRQYFSKNAPSKQLYFQSPKQILASMKKQEQILVSFLGFIGGIALLVGGIGIMNIMLVSVTERRQEIGIRLAVGARRRDIRIMFLIEAIILSLFGGICGVLLGIIISFTIAEIKHWHFTLFILPPIIGFSVSVLVGIFFGYYPAYQASQLNPIETLRTE